ncbi:hypothetical protein I4U23_004553 [Adineta vaga]|nr:hypothetical protein I4U23_004553 [Adineta vaga]
MKIDSSKSADCKLLIDEIKACNRQELHERLKLISIWHLGICELTYWIDVLNLFDAILEEACIRTGKWMLNCDQPENEELKSLVVDILRFTSLLVEHSFSRYLYNSMDYLILLLQSFDIQILLAVLSIFYVFGKRSIVITKLPYEQKQVLMNRIYFLADTWIKDEEKDNCNHLHFIYTNSSLITKEINIRNVYNIESNAALIMELILSEHSTILDEEQQMKLFSQLRLIYAFSSSDQRLIFLQARLQALSILIYSRTKQEQEADRILSPSLIKELIEILKTSDLSLIDTQISIIKTFTSMTHCESYSSRSQKLTEIIGSNPSEGFLLTYARQCFDQLINKIDPQYSSSLSIALLSFIYHLASHKDYVDALVNSGIVQSLIKIINHHDPSQDFIPFVARSVRIIENITDTNHILSEVTNRLQFEITMDQNHHRTALIKFLLNYFKKFLSQISMINITRDLMKNSLIDSLKHIIIHTNVDSLRIFHVIIDVIQSYIFQQPYELSFLQDNGLIEILLERLFQTDRLVEKDVFILFPNISSALCLNTRGLEQFMTYKPFDKLIDTLSIMIKRKYRIDKLLNSTSTLKNIVDKSNRNERMKSIIILLTQLIRLVDDDPTPVDTLVSMFNHPKLNENLQINSITQMFHSKLCFQHEDVLLRLIDSLSKNLTQEIQKFIEFQFKIKPQQFFLRFVQLINQNDETILKYSLFTHLWNALDDCLGSLIKLSDLNTSLTLQSTIEAFFLISSYNDNENFRKFIQTHRTIINEIIHHNRTIEKPYKILLNHPTILDFDIKKQYFRSEINYLHENLDENNSIIHIRSDHVFEDFFEQCKQYSFQDWKYDLKVKVDDSEEILTDWHSLIVHSMYHEKYLPIEYWKFFGYIIGKCLFDNKQINHIFTRSLYKYILDIPIDDNEITKQMDLFREGLYEIIPEHLLLIFNEHELELLI